MMKQLLAIVAISTLLTGLSGCGPSAAEKAEYERLRADSIARAEQAALEAARIDSINMVREAARLDSLRRKETEDSVARVAILPKFVVVKNDGAEGIDSYRAKGTPSGHHQNSAYLSATTDNGRRGELRMHIDYCGNDWIHLHSAILTIDDETFDLTPNDNTQSDVNNDISCSEWFVCTSGIGLFSDKLATAKNVSIKLMGEKGSKTINLSKPQIDNMVETVTLYNLFN